MDILKLKNELEVVQENAKNYYPLKVELIKKAKEMYGDDIFRNCALPNDFNLYNLTAKYFLDRQYQETAMPYSNRLIAEMIQMPKEPVNTIYQENKKGKTIQGVYMVGKNKYNAPVLFAFSIVKDENSADAGYNIKLDVCPQGKLWLNLLRLDVGGKADPHPNIFKGNKVCKDVFEVEYASLPHLHRLSEESQVLCHHALEQTYAISLENIIEQIKGDYNNDTVLACVNYLIKYCNIRTELNKEITSSNDLDFGKYMFSYNKVPQGADVKSLKKYEYEP